MVKYSKKYHFEFAQKDGQDYKYRFILFAGKKMSEINIDSIISGISGIDLLQQVGIYSVEIVVAKTFDPDQVIEAISKRLEVAISDIVLV